MRYIDIHCSRTRAVTNTEVDYMQSSIKIREKLIIALHAHGAGDYNNTRRDEDFALILANICLPH